MDERTFDRVARFLSRMPRSRRAAVRGSLGLFALGLGGFGWRRNAAATPRAQDTAVATPTSDPNAMEIDGAWFCNQTFALCTTAPCERSESDTTIANCHCVVVDSYSIGFKTCEERAQSGKNLSSNFSTVNVNSEFAVLTCPESVAWANCLDVPCEIDALNPAVATCQCEMVEQGPSLTFGGGCNAETCTSTIWSAAPEGLLGLAQYEAGMKIVGQEVVLPGTCPGAAAGTPAATPAA